MKKKHRVRVKREIKEFCFQLTEEIKEVSDTLLSFGIDIKPALPNAFTSDLLSFECVFSEDRQHVLMLIKSSGNSDFLFTIVEGDVFNYFDKSNLWQKMPVGIKIDNSTNVRVDSCGFRGCKPFEIVGNNIELLLNNLSIEIPLQGSTVFEYVIVMSYQVFLNRLKSVRIFARDIVRGYFEHFKIFGVELIPQSIQALQYKQHLESIKLQMEKYFFNETVHESEIDKFIENNPLILEQCFGLTPLLHQIELKDLLNIYGQDLKPDLIGFDLDKKQWAIVDYKRAKRTIIKNLGRVRTSFKVEVFDLQSQLRDYREYFKEQAHRQYVRDRYGCEIELPTTIGVIGRVGDIEVKEFNRLREDIARWMEIVPYNYIYDRFCRFIDTINKFS